MAERAERPLIGITTSLSGQEGASRQVLDRAYVEAVERAGGCPVVVPVTAAPESLRPLGRILDGLVITGGPGITDGLVGSLPEDLPPTPQLRTLADTRAFEDVRGRGRPVLGVCYGMQFINARLGGTIYADAQAQLGAGPHSTGRNGGEPVFHDVEVTAGSRLAELAGGERRVNSHHVQAVEQVGRGLRVNARSPDGLIEGIESDDGLMGVQFHPEQMAGTAWERLFEDLVRRARQPDRQLSPS